MAESKQEQYKRSLSAGKISSFRLSQKEKDEVRAANLANGKNAVADKVATEETTKAEKRDRRKSTGLMGMLRQHSSKGTKVNKEDSETVHKNPLLQISATGKSSQSSNQLPLVSSSPSPATVSIPFQGNTKKLPNGTSTPPSPTKPRSQTAGASSSSFSGHIRQQRFAKEAKPSSSESSITETPTSTTAPVVTPLPPSLTLSTSAATIPTETIRNTTELQPPTSTVTTTTCTKTTTEGDTPSIPLEKSSSAATIPSLATTSITTTTTTTTTSTPTSTTTTSSTVATASSPSPTPFPSSTLSASTPSSSIPASVRATPSPTTTTAPTIPQPVTATLVIEEQSSMLEKTQEIATTVDSTSLDNNKTSGSSPSTIPTTTSNAPPTDSNPSQGLPTLVLPKPSGKGGSAILPHSISLTDSLYSLSSSHTTGDVTLFAVDSAARRAVMSSKATPRVQPGLPPAQPKTTRTAPPKPVRSRGRADTHGANDPPPKPARPIGTLNLEVVEKDKEMDLLTSPRAAATSLSSLMIATIEAKDASPRSLGAHSPHSPASGRGIPLQKKIFNNRPSSTMAPSVADVKPQVQSRSAPSFISMAGDIAPTSLTSLSSTTPRNVQVPNTAPILPRGGIPPPLAHGLIQFATTKSLYSQTSGIARSSSAHSIEITSEDPSMFALATLTASPSAGNIGQISSGSLESVESKSGGGSTIKESANDWNEGASMDFFDSTSATTTLSTSSSGLVVKLSLSEEISTLMRLKTEFESRIEAGNMDQATSITCTSALREVDGKLLQKRKRLMVLFKQLKNQKEIQRKELIKYPNILPLWKRREYVEAVPNSKVMAMEGVQLLGSLAGPEPNEQPVHYHDWACCQTVSTYPKIGGRRAGDPICDVFRLDILDCAWIVAVADGCNWGAAPRVAAERAANSFTHYLKSRLALVGNTRRIATMALRAFSYAHKSIIYGKESEDAEVGTTTLLGGILVPVVSNGPTGGGSQIIYTKGNEEVLHRWTFIFAGVGDCKAFLWSNSTRQISDITSTNRGEVLDARDCGGRLGPYIDGGPDLRNFRAYSQPCSEGDILIICSDGVHDNLDPEQMGKTPKELCSIFSVSSVTDASTVPEVWSECDPIVACDLKNAHRCEMLRKIIEDSCSDPGATSISTSTSSSSLPSPLPTQVTKAVIKHCQTLTSNSRQWMEANPLDPLPCDYTQFPGKMDHTTCVALRVGYISPSLYRA